METNELGDKAWEVEWCYELPVLPEGDRDIDSAKYRRKYFRSIEAAREFAAKVFPQDQFGAVPSGGRTARSAMVSGWSTPSMVRKGRG